MLAFLHHMCDTFTFLQSFLAMAFLSSTFSLEACFSQRVPCHFALCKPFLRTVRGRRCFAHHCLLSEAIYFVCTKESNRNIHGQFFQRGKLFLNCSSDVRSRLQAHFVLSLLHDTSNLTFRISCSKSKEISGTFATYFMLWAPSRK